MILRVRKNQACTFKDIYQYLYGSLQNIFFYNRISVDIRKRGSKFEQFFENSEICSNFIARYNFVISAIIRCLRCIVLVF